MSATITRLSNLAEGEEGDFYALLSEKQALTTRDGKPYFRVCFRDAQKSINFPIWSDSALAAACRAEWKVGEFYKLRALLKGSTYGAQLEIRRIRPVEEADREEGFDPLMCQPVSRFDGQQMFDQLVEIVRTGIDDNGLRQLVLEILDEHQDLLLFLPAAKRNHHAHIAGFLEHVLNVTRSTAYLADYYTSFYDGVGPAIEKDVAIAGAVLHDIGKIRELAPTPSGADYTAAGSLVGHILQGRDMVREVAARIEISPELLLRLEHVIVAHQRLPEWGSPKPPMTPEALLVHFADDLDAKLQMMVTTLAEESGPDAPQFGRTPVGEMVYRGASGKA